MAAVGLALCSAVLFGSMSVALRFALSRTPDAEAGALATAIVALVPCGGVALVGAEWHGRVWPFLLAGLLAPGSSQVFYVLAVRDIGPITQPTTSEPEALRAMLDAPPDEPIVLVAFGGIALESWSIKPLMEMTPYRFIVDRPDIHSLSFGGGIDLPLTPAKLAALVA